MSEYSRSIDVAAAADAAFAFVSDVSNLPLYVPTTQSAEETGAGKVHVEGTAKGEHYADDGHIFTDAAARVMRWGSGASAYRGEMTVSEAAGGSRIALKLHFNAEHAPADAQVEKSLDESLAKLKAQLDG